MSFQGNQRYVPHSETTKGYYEQLLLDLRRCLPPGVDDDLEDIAEQALAIICAGGATNTGVTAEMVQQQQQALEQLLDTPLKRETRDHLLRYGRLITDYVAWQGTEGEDANEETNGVPRGILDLDQEGPSSSTGSSDDSDGDGDGAHGGMTEEELITGMPQRRRHKRGGKEGKAHRKALREDKTLSRYAFDAGDFGEGGFDDDVGPENMFETDSLNGAEWGATVGADGELPAEADAPKITFDEVACNPQYVKDTVRRLFPAQTVEKCEAQAARVVEFLAQEDIDDFALETQLTAFLSGYDNEEVMDWIIDVRGSRWCVVYGLRYAACATQKEKNAVMDAMREHARRDAAVERLYQSLTGKEVDLVGDRKHRRGPTDGTGEEEGEEGEQRQDAARQPPLRRVDLQACAFQDERAPHRYVRASVPQGTQRASYETHDEVTLPPSAAYNKTDPLVPLSAFPTWCHDAFHGVTTLNPMQSRVFDCAFRSDENMLVSAPTGAGKTNVAMMAMLRAIDNATDRATGVVDRRGLKMVYVAPMKALVQEVVRTFSARLEPLGLTVAELSGDSAMSQQQMAETQLIVTTPEKWDIVTRKSVELGVAALLKLLIIDEVHLLHNERGPVLEAIVARTMVQQQLRGVAGIRVVGLSATLPNYEDVAAFLQVDRQRGLFVFDSTYRPIPLEQTFCAIKKVKGLNQAAVMNRVAYDKVLQATQDGEQTMIFVHSRKETEYTALYLQKRANEERHTHYFVRPGSEHEQVLQDAVNNPDSGLRRSLQQLLPGGFAIHHAGLSRDERQTVEELFADRRIKVLVCTSTLAWGVNLPANRVIIKGTRVFNGAKGESELLSALDVLQMFGRAGRVGFGANVGRASIITSAEDLHYYLCVLNQQLPIESQMMKRVVDMLNAEISLGHVQGTKEGVKWLQRTYLYVRMRKVPEVYGVRPTASDPLLLHHLENIVHTACEELKGARMADYDVGSRRVGTTPYGRIASHCYVTTASMSVYLANLSNAMQDVDLFRVFAMSSEFANLTVRVEEQAQLKELLDNAPIAVRESRYTPLAKINILLQCYISRKNLEGLPLMSEIVYIKDSAQRILRALYEICLVREFGRTARQFLQLYSMVIHRQWAIESPIRQVRDVLAPKSFDAILPTLERVRVPWEELRLWSVEDLSERLGDDRRAAMARECIRSVPHVALEASVRPLARSMLYVDVDITPDFQYDAALHGRTVCELLLLVETPHGRIIHSESVYIPVHYLEQQLTYACPPTVVPMVEPKPTHLFVRCASPNWLGCEATAAVCLLNMPLPAVAAPLLEVNRPGAEVALEKEVAVVMEPYRLSPVAEKIFPFERFLACQRELVEPIFEHPTENILAGIAPGGGKTVVAELFVLQFLLECALDKTEEEGKGVEAAATHHGDGTAKKKVLYVTSNEDTAERRYMDWRFKFGEMLGLGVAKLERTRSPDSQRAEVSQASILVASSAALVRWVRSTSPALRDVTHIVADHLHLLRSPEGRAIEECLARLQSAPYLVHGGTHRARLLALSYPLISCAELGRWLKIHASRQYNFGLSYRQLRVRVEGLELPSARSRYETSVVAAMKLLQRSPYAALPSVVFVPYAREAEEVAKRFLLRCRDVLPGARSDKSGGVRKGRTFAEQRDGLVASDRDDDEGGGAKFAAPKGEVLETDDPRLGVLLAGGVGYLHRGTSMLDVLTVLDQLEHPATHPETGEALPLILVCAFDAAWRLPAALFTHAFVCCAERLSAVAEDATQGGAIAAVPQLDCSASELLQMTSRAAHEAVVFARSSRRWVWGGLLNDPLPLESHLRYPEDFCDVVNAAVAEGRARNVLEVLRVLQSHYFLHHVRANLLFYGLAEAEDIPLFASEFASRVVRALKEEGCVDVGEPKPPVAGGQPNEEGDGEGDEDEEDPHALIRATPRGAAIAYHGITLDSVRAVTEAVADALSTSPNLTLTQLWQVLATHCWELSAAQLGDAARITEAAEYRALHTIARALPAETFALRYVDQDFSNGAIKVFLLVLAHCARFFPDTTHAADPTTDGGTEDVAALFHDADSHKDGADVEDGAATAQQHHPFRYAAAATPADRALLLALPATLAVRLFEDLLLVLPAVARVVASMAELLPATPPLLPGALMVLSQCLHRRTWVGEDVLRQLPAVQAAQWPRAVTEAAGLTLPHLQQLAQGEEKQKNKDSVAQLVRKVLEVASRTAQEAASGVSTRATEQQAARARYLEAHLVEEALTIPRVTSLTATGGIDDGTALAGVMALTVTVTAHVAWKPPQGGQEKPAEEEEAFQDAAERRWWLVCSARKKGLPAATVEAPVSGRVLAMRVVTLAPKAKGDPADTMHTVTGTLLFPLAKLEEEGDLEAIDLVVSLTSEAFRETAEQAVTFDSATEAVEE